MNDPQQALDRRALLQQALESLDAMQAKLDAAEYSRTEPIAIVGMGCRFPGGADTPDEYWRLLSDGVDAVGELPEGRRALVAEIENMADHSALQGGFLRGIEAFDPQFFGIAPREAISMDPQQRLVLEVSWEALERAGMAPDRLVGSSTGIFIGITTNDYGQLLSRDSSLLDVYAATGSALNAAPGRVAYLLGFNGPAVAIDSACSSSLVAIHLATQSLRLGECDMALAGGVNIALLPESFVCFTAWGMLASDGRCKAFDAAADGFVRGEGCGVVVLKRLSDAIADGDNILAVVRGSAVNQDGRSAGLTVPSGTAQRAVIEAALRNAKVSPADVQYVEAHGTGTSLGDPIEVQAIGEALGPGRDDERPLYLGSVKTNLGHLESASGIAGLIKTVLMLQHEQIPPHLHLHQRNPGIPWPSFPIEIPTTLSPWPASEGPRLAGVSGFGLSGTNAHVIIEQASAVAQREADPVSNRRFLALSARDEPALRDLAGRYAEHFRAHPDLALGDVAATAIFGRARLPFRLALSASTLSEAAGKLASFAAGEHVPGISTGQAPVAGQPRPVFLFTGQGSQYAGMGQALYTQQPVFRAALDQCAALLHDQLDLPLRDLLFAASDSPEAARLEQTAYTQPALFALEYSLAQLWLSWGITPAAVAGHSLGEYVAATIAGVLSLPAALQLVARRGQLMGALPAGGTMAAVFAPAEQVREVLTPAREQVAIAAVNGPAHTVISGAQAAVTALGAELAAAGIKVRALSVSHAFHSPLMEPMLDAFEAVARGVAYQAPHIPLIANVTGAVWPPGGVADAAYWRGHVRDAVQWEASVAGLLAAGYAVFVEVGPQPVLSGLGKACAGGDTASWLPSLRSSDPQQLYKTLGGLYTSGVSVDWAGVFEGTRARRLRLPTYPWQNERYWFEHDQNAARASLASSHNRLHPLIDRRVRTPSLREVIFEAELDLRTLHYLNDHQAHETVLLPATAMLEMVVASGREYDGRQYEVAELMIREPFPLSAGESRIAQTILRPEGEVLAFEVISAGIRDEWRQHATGRLSVVASAEPVPGLDEICSATARELDVDVLYERLAAIGMQYGPAFRGITRLYLDDDGVLGRIALPVQAGDPHDYIMHPALLDACVQVAGALIPDAEDVVYLPASLEGVVIHGKPGRHLWSKATALPASDEATLVCTFDVYNDDGARIASVRRAVFRRASQATLAAAIGKLGAGLPLYEVSWRETPLTPIGRPAESGRWLIFATASDFGADVASTLRDLGERVDLIEPGAVFARTGPDHWKLSPSEPDDFRRLLREASQDSNLRGVIYLWAVDGCADDEHSTRTVRDSVEGALHLTQALAAEMPVPVWLVTRGAQPAGGEVTSPAQAAIWGLARALRREHPELCPVCVDLDPGHDPDLAATLVAELFAVDDEQEVALRSGMRLVGRLICHREAPTEPTVRLEIAERGAIDGLELRDASRCQPGPGEVEIRVRATGLNFRDVLNTLGLYPDPTGHPGSECAGIISAVGIGVTEFKPGDPVMAMAEDSFATYALAPAALTARLPARASFAEAATLPIAFVTAIYSLRRLAGLKPGMRVLIHSATGGVGLAALQTARAGGAEIFATAGSDGKRDYLRSLGIQHVYDSRSLGFADEIRKATAGRGVDIVLNSLTGELIPESLEALRDGGCFLEIGKNGIWTADEVAALGRGIIYHPIYLGAVCKSDPELIGGILREIRDEIACGSLSPLPLRTFPFQRAVDAFRLMAQTRHIGKVVVTQESPGREWQSIEVRPNSSYLVTGGLGGVGLEVARWLVLRGAGCIVLAGRSEPSDTARQTLADLEQAGAQVLVVGTNISNEDDVARLFATIDEQAPPLAGVIHAAGALDDGVLAQQNWSRFERVFAPKLDGAWLLHEMTEDRDLDFFVLFSAGAALVGNPGQANYVAANAAIDALAHWRRARGLPAVSINWGPWGEVGMAAGVNDDVQRRLNAQGFHSLSTDDGLRGLEAALAAGTAQLAVLPVDWERFADGFAPASPPSLFRDIARKPGEDHDADEAGRASMAEVIAATPASLRRGAVLRCVRETAAHVLGVLGSDAVPAGRPLSELGLDSLMAVEVRNLLGRALAMQLPTTLLFDFPTPDALADYLLECLGADGGDGATPSTDAAVNVEGLEALDLAALSEEEAERLLLAELGDG